MALVDDPIRLVKDLGAPLLLLAFGGFGKSLIRASSDNWFLGPDLILAGVGTALAYGLDDAKTIFAGGSAPSGVKNPSQHGMVCGAYVFIAVFIFQVVLRLHQAWEPHPGFKRHRMRKFLLGFVGNFIGLAALASLLFLLPRF